MCMRTTYTHTVLPYSGGIIHDSLWYMVYCYTFAWSYYTLPSSIWFYKERKKNKIARLYYYSVPPMYVPHRFLLRVHRTLHIILCVSTCILAENKSTDAKEEIINVVGARLASYMRTRNNNNIGQVGIRKT